MTQKKIINFMVDPENPEQSVRDHIARADKMIAFFKQDTGDIIALRYTGDEPLIADEMNRQRTYAMIRPEPDAPAAVGIYDTYANYPASDAKLAEFKEQGFEIIGYCNRYTDRFGLVESEAVVAIPGTDQRIKMATQFDGLHFITHDQAIAARDAWLLNASPTRLEEAKQPFIDQWTAFRAGLEDYTDYDWTAFKQQARLRALQRGQNPDMN